MIVIAESGKMIEIGRVGEDNRTRIVFPLIGYKYEMGEGVPALLFRRPNDETAYPVPITVSDDGLTAIWDVSEIDTEQTGFGEAQLVYTPEGKRGKSTIYKVFVDRSLTGGNTPDPHVPWMDQVLEAAAEVMQAVEDVPEAIDEALEEAKESGEFDGPPGRDGTDGQDGRDGTDGVSPTISVTDIPGGHRVVITDATGSNTIDVMDGTDGRDGTNGRDGTDGVDGQDGFSPSISVTDITDGHRVTVTNKTGSSSFDVMDGADGAPGAPGTPGQNGQDGQDGQDGFSPTLTVTTITGGHRVTITDKNGTQTVDIMDGAQGPQGNPGTPGTPGQNGQDGQDGSDGTTFTPSVSSAGVISWTNDGGKQNPPSVDLVTAVINALPTAVGVSF